MGKLHEASATYAKALEIANLTFSLEHKDFPALYAAADAYAGLGNVAAAQARQTRDPAEQSQQYRKARTAYEKSLEVWKQVPNPSRISGNGYLAGDPRQVALRLGSLAR
jgi:tetratricopeptide (TPR) repeat protein